MKRDKHIKDTFRKQGVTLGQWTDWRWQLANSIKTVEQLALYTDISPKKIAEIENVIKRRYQNGRDSMRITPYLLSLMDLKNPKDPISLQHLPHPDEKKPDLFSYQNVWEKPQDFLDGKNRLLQQKYPDIAVLRISNTCQSFCRFCFEKERTLRSDVPTIVGANEFDEALALIRKKKRIRQILLSGGDPSVLPDQILKEHLEKLMLIPHLKIIRINTRTLLHNPYRITEEFAKMLGNLQRNSWKPNLKNGKLIHIGVHFNHPHELTEEALKAIRLLQSEGIQLYNQTVLLKGINDSAKILQQLFRKLRAEGVHLHYLSHAMPVPRTGHFRTSLRKGLDLLQQLKETKEFRAQLPHYEMSHHTGKQIVENFSPILKETSAKNSNRNHRAIRFKSDITGKWETQPDGTK